MPDVFTKSQRSRVMAAIRGKDTGPELAVRRLVHRMGCRFRLHGKSLPGRPDLVLPGRQAVIFVHGCFWHRHGCVTKRGKRGNPVQNRAYWQAKFEANIARDRRNIARLRRLGWRVLVVWECQTHPRRIDWLTDRIARFLAKQ